MNEERPGYVESIYRMVVERGPVVAGDLSQRTAPKGTWWDWDHAKVALEWLFYSGRVTARRRVNDFARAVRPARADAAAGGPRRCPTPPEADARKALLVLAARAPRRRHRCATWPTTTASRSRRAGRSSAELVEDGRLVAGDGRGLEGAGLPPPRGQAAPAGPRPRAALAVRLAGVGARPRLERLFGFHYRIEIYTPAPKRRFGYYVLPFLLGDELVGRVDLKADRAASALLVRGAYLEPGVPDGLAAEELAEELALMAGWLGLERIVVEGRGDLAPALRAAVGGDGAHRRPR